MKVSKSVKTAIGIVSVLWSIYLLNLLLPIELRQYGLQPRNIYGLWGIAFAPFLHGNLQHLIVNTSALFFLLVVSFSLSQKLTIAALFIILIGGGGLVWLFGKSNTLHIGASGIVFGMIGFLIFLGLFRREWKILIISIAIFFLYGKILLSLFVYMPGISWTGHFFGFLTGILAAGLMKTGKIK
jgi:membrane associated rhomboid family serine protease